MKNVLNVKVILCFLLVYLSGQGAFSQIKNPPGYTDPLAYPETCFDEMGQIEFTSRLMYNTSTATADLLYTYIVPLVGDIDNDGYPEIITMGTAVEGISGPMRYVTIYNGEKNEKLAEIPFYIDNNSAKKFRFTYGTGYHASPSYMALLNTGRDTAGVYTFDSNGGKKYAELIVAFSDNVVDESGTNSTERGYYESSVASYDLVKQASSGSSQYRMVERWRQKYFSTTSNGVFTADAGSTTNFRKPIPQVVDIDGDGNAEVIVYNKIFDAKTGTPLLGLGNLTASYSTSTHVGRDEGADGGDPTVNFSFTYDMDFDGTYDYVAGGQLYRNIKPVSIGSTTWSSDPVITMTGVPDGRTGVADVNGDGIPDVVVVKRTSSTKVKIYVWNPGLFQMDSYTHAGKPVLDGSGNLIPNATPQPFLMAELEFSMNGSAYGSNSYVYIGDIDGREQIGSDGKTYRLPEISILGGEFKYLTSGSSDVSITRHPNLAGTSGIDTSPTEYSTSVSESRRNGDIVAVTWDTEATTTASRLKLSFVMEHKDRSANTGFTLFDFDNDGVQEICYRDEQLIRIIKGNKPQIKLTESDPNTIVFKQTVTAATAFEYPVIADVNNDASAEIVTLGRSEDYRYCGQLRVFGADGDKFAPAWPVWNQFMYSPFKIKPDLTIPTPAERITNPLQYKYARKVHEGNTTKVLYEYQPFNGNIFQAAKFIEVEDVNDPGEVYYEPMVFLTESYIIDNNDPTDAKRPKVVDDGGTLAIDITIGNYATAQTDIGTNTPIMVYKGSVSKSNLVYKQTLANISKSNGSSIEEGISAGEEVRIRLSGRGNLAASFPGIVDEDAIYWVRLGDNSEPTGNVWRFGFNSERDGSPNPDLGEGIASRAFRDCYWGDQTVRAAKLNVFHDAATVQAYNEVEIDFFDNDILPDTYYDGFIWDSDVLNSCRITTYPQAGHLTIVGTGRDLKVLYKNVRTDNLTQSVDSFVYKAHFLDTSLPSGQQNQVKYATVYIYVLQSETGFASCTSTHTVQLKELPAGNVSFIWEKDGVYLQTGSTRAINFGAGQADSVYMVEPRITLSYSDANFRGVSFPEAKLAVKRTDGATTFTLKWIGLESTDWYNPNNWVEIRSDKAELPATFTPTTCTDVIIASGAEYYPVLRSVAMAKDIKMEDRAMIAGIHHLTYENASVEIELQPSEKDRFVMWSAPLKSVYSGDYHYKNNSDQPLPQWGDVYMNLFQYANPAGGAPAGVNKFTATFGELDESLGLGKAFNLKVTSTSNNRNKSFTFPQTALSYTVSGKGTFYTPRNNGTKFITDGIALTNGMFDMPAANDMSGSYLIQVVNPYMAYLRISDFFANNTGLTGTYAVWNGETNVGFSQEGTIGDGGNRFSISSMPSSTVTSGYIAPLQSFFVQKTSTAAKPTVKMSPLWTTTAPVGESNPYELRADTPEETNVLRVKASQGDRASYAVLFYHETAHASFNPNEDMNKLFYDEIPLEVYTFAPTREMLAIHSSNDFSQDVPLGLRIKDAGSITLDFTGMPTFGHKVYLIDKKLIGNNQVIDLQKNPSYTFTATKENGSEFIELDDRFLIRTEYTGTGLDNETVEVSGFNVYSKDGCIYVSNVGQINSIQVYNIKGALVYSSNKASNSFRIPAESMQTYIVKAMIGGGEYKVEKVFVK